MGLRTMKRRRRENKTDYKLRKSLLVSGVPRIVVRQTNKHFILQAVESDSAQDKVIKGLTSKDLLKEGWKKEFKGSLKSVPAAYLTGFLFAKKMEKGKFIVDLGMAKTLPGTRIFAVVKGLIDGGLDITANKKVFPSEERIRGEHLKEEVKANIESVSSKLGVSSKEKMKEEKK